MNKKLGFILICVLVLADQISKLLVENYLPFHEGVAVIPFFSFFRTYNEGVAFSFLADLNDWALVAFTLVVCGFVFWLWSKVDRKRSLSHLGFGLVISGALGNLIDRVLLGYVIDFIQFHTQSWSFAIFNLADAYISVGAAIIIFDEVLDIRKQNRNQSNSNN
ncbi:MAG: signal peptidase II [Rhizobiaceae bacterium]|nr:signal peptidase II [Rhizobiaceae bacterium]